MHFYFQGRKRLICPGCRQYKFIVDPNKLRDYRDYEPGHHQKYCTLDISTEELNYLLLKRDNGTNTCPFGMKIFSRNPIVKNVSPRSIHNSDFGPPNFYGSKIKIVFELT